MASAVNVHAQTVKDALTPWAEACGSFNFSERVLDGQSLYPPPTYLRLQEIKAA
jgi:hypothetical protein